jgi:alkylhydroperoxidase family enzyme
MPRLSKFDLESAPDDVKPIFKAIYEKRGNIPNMFRTMAHRPEILKTMDAHFKAVMAPTTLSVRLKELVVLRVSEINGCDY